MCFLLVGISENPRVVFTLKYGRNRYCLHTNSNLSVWLVQSFTIYVFISRKLGKNWLYLFTESTALLQVLFYEYKLRGSVSMILSEMDEIVTLPRYSTEYKEISDWMWYCNSVISNLCDSVI